MFPLNYALAVALLSASPDPADKPADVAAFTTVRPTLQCLGVAWELLDPRECRRTFMRAEDLACDLRLLRKRYDELCDAPPLHDCMRFPDRSLVNEMIAFNRAYKAHLESRAPLELTWWWELHESLQETERLFQIWDLVRDARCQFYYVNVRRGSLKKLRETLGPVAYYGGQLPPHVPIWRFARID